VKTSGGLKTIWIVQVCCTASDGGHVLVCVNVPSAGAIAIPEMATGAGPSFVRMAIAAPLDPTATLPGRREAER